MIHLNDKTNLLEETLYHYQLQDVEEPNLFRDSFNYVEVPKVSFNHRLVPMDTPSELWLTDTTFRDGQQSTSPFSVEQIVEIFKFLHKLGGEKGMIRQSEFFLYSEKDKKAVEKCMELGFEFPEVTSWIRANEKDFEIVKSMGIKETGILVSCSDYHIFNKMDLTRRQAMDKYLGIVKAALSYGVIPRCHFEDITRADFYGFVVPFATELMKLSKEANVPIKIRACDTMGFGVPYHGASMPRSVPGIIYGLKHYADVPSELLEWHGHNDFYKVVANASTAWLYGCSAVNCSLLGIGERTGNCPLEAMAIEYASIKGNTNGMDFKVITEIADYFENEIGYSIPPMTPFVGRYFNSTRAGIHADGMLKNEEIYNIFDTKAILNRAPRIAITNTSGLAGIAYWIDDFYDLKGENKIEKNDELVLKLKNA
ncbi:MAG: 2-isopropylmalate synthase, partial [Clostridia bacterium]